MSKLINMLKKHEGSKSHAYKCTAGKITVGVGRNIDPEGGLGLSPEEINYLLTNDIERVEDELSGRFPWIFEELSDVRIDALINICFNLGLPRFLRFVKALDCLEAGDYDQAADEFMDSLWARQVGYRAYEVSKMIRTGKYQEEY
jgi:lysozyme